VGVAAAEDFGFSLMENPIDGIVVTPS
jgi:hypothetical protein